MRYGKRAGIYVVLVCDQTQEMLNLYHEYFAVNGYVISTCMQDIYIRVLHGLAATRGKLPNRGKVLFRNVWGETIDMDVPFYAPAVIKDICKGNILPVGVKFSAHKLECLRKRYFGVK